ncbi:DNA internalization-related competence protein ComEC/Rec2 [Rhodoferax antarcticus ANT.BR]|uniref:DNA internalization-related competence protein ComEC/Rec2 n=2 Tax=Rhodoferax antarcticus TaxID=81479 RepID=A0A1Q8YEQ4_9BURK|nr:DNA internalization-related competence protein ComEC/Rec2 [Rhodoferax antarcticus ANT.BR]
MAAADKLRSDLAPALLGVLAGSAMQVQQAVLWSGSVYMFFMLLALVSHRLIAIFSRVNRRLRHGSVNGSVNGFSFLLIFALLAFGASGWRATAFVSGALDPALEGRDIQVAGVVSGLPQPFEGGVRFRFDAASATLDGQSVTLPKRLELAWYAGGWGRGDDVGASANERQRAPQSVQAGERWQMTVRLKAPHGSVNPHGFDYELWQWVQGVQATGYVRASRHDLAPQRLQATWLHPVDSLRQRVRERIFASVPDPNAAGVVAALVTGDQRAIERADWNVFRATGVAHLMSISGLHITMFAWLAAALVGAGWRRSGWLCLWLPAPSAALIGGVLLAGGYALFSGWGVPAQRTVLMLATVGALRLSGVRWPWPQVWLLACAVVVAVDPWALLQAGFWLSFVAVGVLFASDSGAFSPDHKGVGGRFVSLLREQWVITLALTPLVLLLFGQVSLVGLLANALAIAWVTLLVTPLAMLGALLPGVWSVAAWAVQLMVELLQALANWPWAVLWLPQAPVWAGLAGVLGGVLLAMRLPWSLRLAGLPLLLPVLLWQAPLPPAGQFELLAADVGQGSAVLVRTQRHALLFDAGPRFSSDSDAGQRVLVPLLRALSVQLDTLVLSHRDSDHTGGAAAVLALQPQARLLGSLEDEHALLALRPLERCVVGQRWQWDGVDFEMLHPLAADYGVVNKTNAMSCVLRISSAKQSALLAGDIERAQEADLVRRLTLAQPQSQPQPLTGLQADVLLAPHHGSHSSSGALFLDAVQPRLVLVQAGYRNRFGHPHGAVLARYAAQGAQVLDTPHCGAITWQSWQADTPRCERQAQQRYWRHQVPP